MGFKLVTLNDIHHCSKRPVSLRTLRDNVEMINNSGADGVALLGDNVMDAMTSDPKKLETDCNQVSEELNNLKIPKYGVLGNHDWMSVNNNPDFLKRTWGAANAYDRVVSSTLNEHWLLIGLPSISLNPDSTAGYDAILSDESFEELERTLAENQQSIQSKHVLIMSHVPIVSITPLMDRKHPMSSASYTFPANHLHADCFKIVKLFENYPEIKLCISGHMHMVDEVKYKDISYICCGSLCGLWWSLPSYKGHSIGNMFFDLNDDGTFESNYEQTTHS